MLWAAVSRRRNRPAWALRVQAVKSHDNQGLHQSNRVGWSVRPSNFFERQEIQFIQTFHNAFYSQQSRNSAHRVYPTNREVIKLQYAHQTEILSKNKSGGVQSFMSVKEKIASRSAKVRPLSKSTELSSRFANHGFQQESLSEMKDGLPMTLIFLVFIDRCP